MTGWLGWLIWTVMVIIGCCAAATVAGWIIGQFTRIQPDPTPPIPPRPCECSYPPCDNEDGWICKLHYQTHVLPGIQVCEQWANND